MTKRPSAEERFRAGAAAAECRRMILDEPGGDGSIEGSEPFELLREMIETFCEPLPHQAYPDPVRWWKQGRMA